MEVISCKEAKALGLKRYYTGKLCKYGHDSERFVSSTGCIKCQSIRFSDWVDRNRDYWNKVSREWQRQPHVRQRRKVYTRKYYLSNKDRFREYGRAHYIANKGAYYAWVEFRRERTKERTPPWLTDSHKDKIKSYHNAAIDCSTITGEPYEVDHIVPLYGDTVSGLHVPWNMQILPRDVNRSKWNKFYEQDSI